MNLVNPKVIMHRWSGSLQSLLKNTHLYQVEALAALSFACACARHCHLSRVAAYVPTAAQPQSSRRRLLRFLSNPRLDVEAICQEMAAWLGRWNSPTARLLLLLDETPLRNELRVLKISVAYHRRALPLVWCCYPLKDRGQPMPETVTALVERAYDVVHQWAPQAQVVLLADRGLCWPSLIRQCQSLGWHYLLRAQKNTRCRLGQQTRPIALATLAPQRGKWWCGEAQVFATAGWLSCQVVACWPHEAKEAWLLLTSLPPTLHACRWYARRIWQEQSFRDEKSHGFAWHLSQVRTPERVNHLLLLLALAGLWLMRLGQEAQRPPWRQRLGLQGRSNRRRWSWFRTGWHLLLYTLHNPILPPSQLDFAPP